MGFRVLEMLSVHNEISIYHFVKFEKEKETFDAEEAAVS